MKYPFYQSAIILLLAALSLSTTAHAQDADFDTTYNIEYQLDNSLVVNVKEDIGVINQNSSAIPSHFIETITNIAVYDIKVLDSKSNEITPQIQQNGTNAVIKIPIQNPAIGKDKTTKVSLLYKTRDLSQKAGRILNVNIPKAPVSDYIQEYNVSIKIPKDFGPQISVTPKPVKEQMEESGYVLSYNKQTLEKYGISASFGDYQIFNFTLNYELENPSVFTKNLEIALPMPIQEYQEINLIDIRPTPIKLKKDPDGNVLAVYRLPGKKKLAVEVTGKAKVYNKKVEVENLERKTLPFEFNKYLSQKKYWEVQDKRIIDIAHTLTAKIKANGTNALAIYTYLTKNITYDFERAKQGGKVERKGANKTLLEKRGLCADFADSFIALARASGIPAREIDGYAYAKDPNSNPTPLGGNHNEFLHSWAQFYDPGLGWVSIDPTWGATSGLDYFSKLDNNHLAFVIKGVDSQSPGAAQQIRVTFSDDDFFERNSKYDLTNLKAEGDFRITSWVVGASVLVLGMCTTFLLSKARLKPR